jgi:hypothetical protein
MYQFVSVYDSINVHRYTGYCEIISTQLQIDGALLPFYSVFLKCPCKAPGDQVRIRKLH